MAAVAKTSACTVVRSRGPLTRCYQRRRDGEASRLMAGVAAVRMMRWTRYRLQEGFKGVGMGGQGGRACSGRPSVEKERRDG